MIASVTPQIRGLILDMDGVLWRGDEPIGDLPQTFSQIEKLGIKTVFATNNSSLSPKNYQRKLAGFGVKVNLNQIVTSATATAFYLKDNFLPPGPIYVIGSEGLQTAVDKAGFLISENNAIAVIVGLDKHFTYHKLLEATYLIRNGATFIASNPDRTYPNPQGLTPGAGSLVAAVEAATDVSPVIIGKPSPKMFEIAEKQLNIAKETILVVGDRLETDIAGGQNAGFQTALILTGVSTKKDVVNGSIKPDFISPNLGTLIDNLMHIS